MCACQWRRYSTNIAELYKQCGRDWDITKKSQVLVTDNARNMASADNRTSFVHFPCLAGRVGQQLRILHGFKATDTETLFVKCRNIIVNLNIVLSTQLNCRIVVIHHWVGYSKMFQQDGTVSLWCCIVFCKLEKQQQSTCQTMRSNKKVQNYAIFIGREYVSVLDLFCQATVLSGVDKYEACSCVLPPLLSSLTKHMTVNDNDPGYIARLKAAPVNDISEPAADMKSIEMLQIATALDPRYKILKCLSHYAKEQT